jgi:peptidoglycan/xylan/chitin deacetylase (PgdA/CDA1 family)
VTDQLERRPLVDVLLTFDLDGETLWISRDEENLKRPIVLSQGAYGPKVGAWRILKLLERYGITSTFFVPGWIAERYGPLVEDILRRHHEIAHHGYLHEWPTNMGPQEERDKFELALETLRRITGRDPVGYRSPAWEFSAVTLKLLAEKHFLYSSNAMDSDAPYEHVIDGKPSGVIELPVSWTLDDAPHFLLSLTTPGRVVQNARQILEMWIDEFDGLVADGEPRVCVLTMHPQIIGRPSRVLMLENFIKHVRACPQAGFATCREAAERFKGAHR